MQDLKEFPDVIIPPKPIQEQIPRLERMTKHISEMTEKERNKILCPKSKESYDFCIKEGLYNCKRDRCKEMRDCEEQSRKQKDDLMNAQFNKITELEAVIIKQNKLLAQIIEKIKNI